MSEVVVETVCDSRWQSNNLVIKSSSVGNVDNKTNFLTRTRPKHGDTNACCFRCCCCWFFGIRRMIDQRSNRERVPTHFNGQTTEHDLGMNEHDIMFDCSAAIGFGWNHRDNQSINQSINQSMIWQCLGVPLLAPPPRLERREDVYSHHGGGEGECLCTWDSVWC